MSVHSRTKSIVLTAIWPRLAWKEMRESWTMVGICLALPLALIPLCGRVEAGWRPILLGMGLVVSALLLVLWAVDRVHNKWLVPAKARMQLPISLPVRWTALFLLPLPVPVLTGIVLAVTMHAYYANCPFKYLLTMMVLGTVSLFLLTTALTTIITPIPAVCAGACWMFTLGYYLGDDLWNTPNYALFLRAAFAALLASLVWEFFARRFRYLAGRLVAIGALLGIILGPTSLFSDLRLMAENHARMDPDAGGARGYYISPDQAVLLQQESGENMRTRTWEKALLYQNRRTGISKRQVVTPEVTPLAVIGETRVLFLQQREHERRLHCWEWETTSDQAREIMPLPAQPRDLYQLRFASADPRGRYLLLGFRARRGPGCDIWLLDLAQQRSALVQANLISFWEEGGSAFGQTDCTWFPEYAMLASGSGTVRVDLATMRAEFMEIAYPKGRE